MDNLFEGGTVCSAGSLPWRIGESSESSQIMSNPETLPWICARAPPRKPKHAHMCMYIYIYKIIIIINNNKKNK
jgi:hypothetical protein